MNIKLYMMNLLPELYLFRSLSVTMAIFHSTDMFVCLNLASRSKVCQKLTLQSNSFYMGWGGGGGGSWMHLPRLM